MNSFNRNTTTHQVVPGDTLFSIANRYSTTIEEIMDLNNMSSTTIYPNQILVVPYMGSNGMMYKEYLTQSGDTLEIIEQKSGVNLETLEKYNDFTKLELVPNQIIKIPNSERKTYVILEEDDLDLILEKTGLTPREIILLNEEDWLKVGNEIIIG